MNYPLVTRHDGTDRRIQPRAQTIEAKLVVVIGERGGNCTGNAPRGQIGSRPAIQMSVLVASRTSALRASIAIPRRSVGDIVVEVGSRRAMIKLKHAQSATVLDPHAIECGVHILSIFGPVENTEFTLIM